MSLPTGFLLDGELKSIVWMKEVYNRLVVEIQAKTVTQVTLPHQTLLLRRGSTCPSCIC